MSFFQYPDCHAQPLLQRRYSGDACDVLALLMIEGLFKMANGAPSPNIERIDIK